MILEKGKEDFVDCITIYYIKTCYLFLLENFQNDKDKHQKH